MLYSLGRESESTSQWAKVVGPVVQDAKELPVEGLGDVLNVWATSVSYLGESELHARKADRYEIFFDAREAFAETAHGRFKSLNDKGLEGLEEARGRLGKVQRGFKEWDSKLKGRDLSSELDEHRQRLFAELAEVEMKPSDARKLRELVDEAVDTTKKSGVAGLAGWMDKQLERGIRARRQPDRGASENFAIWKLAAVIALLVALGIAFWIHCGWFSCSVYSQNNYIAAILTTASLWWC